MSTALTPRRGTLPNGIWAIALVIATEGAFLGCLIASYLFLATRVPEWPPPGVPEPRVLAPVLLTALLVLTAALVFAASSFARRGRAHAAPDPLAFLVDHADCRQPLGYVQTDIVGHQFASDA